MPIATTIKTVWPDAVALSHAVANLIVTESNKAIQQKGYFTIALSGGGTPKLLFELLAQAPYKNNIPWKKVIIAFGDERFVAPTSDESNYKMANEALLKHVGIPKKNILIVPTVKVTPAQSASQYETALKKYISNKHPFDLVLLGIGEEGHTASIFPGSPLLTDKKNWIKNIWVVEKNMDRISFTMPFINHAKNIAFLVSGASKAAILKKIFSKPGATLPAAMVKAKENTFWFLDEAAKIGH
ncbi:6-phosphogluconolactonase [Ferruginibacter sp. SUN106]|uniref:6-phosphogluconolactonase n=1 Tax=Ferruginibacter sp. SUN106 TaxID=2978348 RepID=UPI003D36150C